MMNKNYEYQWKGSMRQLFNEGRWVLNADDAFQHDVKFMLENGNDFCIPNTEILRSLKINDLESFLRRLRKIDAEILQEKSYSNYYDITVDGFIVSYSEDPYANWRYYASPIVVIDADETFFKDHNLDNCGRYGSTFYTSKEVWDDIVTYDNWDELMDIYADPDSDNMYPGEHILGLSYYGDLGHNFYRCDEIALGEEV